MLKTVSAAPSKLPDKIALWPSLLVAAMVIGDVITQAVPGLWFFWVVPVVFLGALIPIVLCAPPVVLAIRSALRRHWRRVASLLILPGAVLFDFAAPRVVDDAVSSAAWPLQFMLVRSDLDALVEKGRTSGEDKLVVLTVDGFGSMAAGFAFDFTDEMSRPPGTQSQTWKSLAANTELSGTCWSAEHVSGHYYRWYTPGC